MGSDLKKQFVNYMTLNRYSEGTIRNYVRIITDLARFHNKAPDQLNNDQIQEYLLHLLNDRKISWGTCNIYYSGLACFYKRLLMRDKTTFSLPPGARTKKLPQILSVEEVKRLFELAASLKHRVLLKATYAYFGTI